VNWTKGFTVFLEDAKPSGTVRRIRRLIDSSRDFMPYDFADFLVYTRRYGDVALNPRSVGHDREFYSQGAKLVSGPMKNLGDCLRKAQFMK
jgi:hypothetical protein